MIYIHIHIYGVFLKMLVTQYLECFTMEHLNLDEKLGVPPFSRNLSYRNYHFPIYFILINPSGNLLHSY